MFELIDEKTEYITRLFSDVETRLIYAIIERINRVGITPTGEIQLRKLYDMGALDLDVLRLIEELTGYPLEELLDVIPEVLESVIAWETHTKAYELGMAIKPPTREVLKPLIEQVQEKIRDDFHYIKTTAREYVEKDYRRIIDTAILETQMGTKTEQQAVVDIAKELSQKGITAMTYLREGKTVQMGIEPYVRRVVRTEFIQNATKAQEVLGQDIGADLYYVTQHLGARDKGIGHENHESWQGQTYSMQELRDVCGYGLIDGLGGINCRHTFYAFWEGVTPIPPKIDTSENARVYELEQEQRRIERDIRRIKREINSLELLHLDDKNVALRASKRRLRTQQARVRQLVKDNQDVLRRDYAREQVYTTN